MKSGLVIANRAKRQLRRLTEPERRQIDSAYSEMCRNPYQGDVRFIKASAEEFLHNQDPERSWRRRTVR